MRIYKNKTNTKREKMKKLIMGMLVMLVTVVQLSAEMKIDGDWVYDELATGYCVITRYIGNDTNIVIPETLGNGLIVGRLSNYTVPGPKYIDGSIFVNEDGKKNTTVVSVTIPANVFPNLRSFKNCTALKTVVMKNNNNGWKTDIGSEAFEGCTSLESFDTPEDLSTIADNAFKGCLKFKNMIFNGNAPVLHAKALTGTSRDLQIFYRQGKTGFNDTTYSKWNPIALTASGDYVLDVADGAGASVDNDGGDTVVIAAATPAVGETFRRWIGDTDHIADVTKSATTVRMLSDNISVTATYTADPNTSDILTKGVVTTINAVDVPVDQFTRRPRVYVTYFDPIRDPLSLKVKKTNLRTLTRVSVRDPKDSVDSCWTRNIALYSRRALNVSYKNGIKFKNFTGQVTSLEVEVHVAHREGGVRADDVLTQTYVIVPPEITSVETTDGVVLVDPVEIKDEIVIKGSYFGNRPPKVYFEYTVRGRIRKLNCRVLRPYAYSDIRGKAGRSCMDKTTGASQITVQMPRRWPRGWVHGVNDLVIDNRIGMATTTIETQ